MPAPVAGTVLRVVESQEQVATTTLVDTLAEQSRLEELLEVTKPPLRPGSAQLHYLLATPFRYPPLRHGSRFGQRHQPSLFYGSATVRTALAEIAYYRFVFWSGMASPPPSQRLLTQHTVFAAAYRCERGLRLQLPPCARFRSEIADPSSYQSTQALGTVLREQRIAAFEYPSARDPAGGLNVALYRPACLDSPAPLWQRPCLCETRADMVRFNADEGISEYPLSAFLVGGTLPQPAP